VLRIIFGVKGHTVTGEWGINNEELHNFHSSHSTVTLIKSRRIDGRTSNIHWGERKCI
jgi:hypothetical protein